MANNPNARRTITLPRRTILANAIAIALLGCDVAYALPTDPVVETGQAAIKSAAPNALTVRQTTDKAVINWRSFGIGAGESVEFAQPSSSAVVLNRVLGMDPSQLLGDLKANGRVFLVNPNGIVFGRNARVDVGGLVASTLSLSTQDFLANRLRFTKDGSAGVVRNEGAITAGSGGIALIAPTVANQGNLRADGASVGLIAGDTVLVDVDGDGLMAFRVESGALAPRIEQLGRIQADGGSVSLQAKARAVLSDTVLNMEGIVQARGIGQKSGRIVLDGGPSGITRVAGTLDARSSQGRGGDISVTSEKVLIDASAKLDGSGVRGGAIRIGGGIRGSDRSIENAEQVHIADGALLQADGSDFGAGGSLVVWSNRSTYVGGALRTQGKSGGFIETSSAGHLDIAGTPNAGVGGSWLIDPLNIEIVPGDSVTNATGSSPFSPSATGSQIGVDKIVGALDAGTTVKVTTVGSGPAAENGDIILTADLKYTRTGDNGRLVLDAAGSVILNGKISGETDTTRLNLTLQSGTGGIRLNNSTIDLKNGSFTASAPTSLLKDVTITAQSGASFGKVDGAYALAINTSGTATFSEAVGGTTPLSSLTVSGATNALGVKTNGAQAFNGIATLNGVYTTGDGDFSAGGAVRLGGDTSITAGSGAITFSGTVNGAHLLSTSNSASTSFVGAVGNSTPLRSLTVSAGIVNAAQTITTSGALSVTAIDISANSISTGGDITLTGAVSLTGAIATSNDSFSVFGATTLTGATTINTGSGAIIFDGSVDGAQSLSTISSAGTSFGAGVGLSTRLGSLSVTGPVDARGVKASGAIAIGGPATLQGAYSTTGGDFGVTGATTLAGASSVSTGSGAISFGSTVDGAYALSTTNTGGTIFSGTVGASSPLTALTASAGSLNAAQAISTSGTASLTGTSIRLKNLAAGGDIALQGDATLSGNYTTTGGYFGVTGATTLAGDTTVSTGSGAIRFGGTVDGAHALLLTNSGTTHVGGAFGATTPLRSLTITGGGLTELAVAGTSYPNIASVTTTNDQTYDDPVQLEQPTFLKSISGSIKGLLWLDRADKGFAKREGAIGGCDSIVGTFSASGSMPCINLLGDVTLNASGTLTFSGPVDGAYALNLDGNFDKTFAALVGGATNLASLTSNGIGTTQLVGAETNGGAISIVGNAALSGNYTTTGGYFGVTGATTLAGDTTVSTGSGISALRVRPPSLATRPSARAVARSASAARSTARMH